MNPFFTSEVLRRLKAARGVKDPDSNPQPTPLPRGLIFACAAALIALVAIIIWHFAVVAPR